MNIIDEYISFIKVTKNLSNNTLAAYYLDLKQFMLFEPNILAPDICSYLGYLTDKLKLKDTSNRPSRPHQHWIWPMPLAIQHVLPHNSSLLRCIRITESLCSSTIKFIFI